MPCKPPTWRLYLTKGLSCSALKFIDCCVPRLLSDNNWVWGQLEVRGHCKRQTKITGRHSSLLSSSFGSVSPPALLLDSKTAWLSTTCWPKLHLKSDFTWNPSLEIRLPLQSKESSSFLFPFHFFYTNISPNKIHACLVLSLYLLRRGTGLI